MKKTMFCICILLLPCLSFTENWFCGQWNSTINNLDEHPRTIAVRVEVVDQVTGMPIPGCQVTFKGSYKTEYKSSRDVGGPRPAQQQEFERSVQTRSDGVAVGAFYWEKEYPWDRGIDDAEKVQGFEIRHPNYAYSRQALPFVSLFRAPSDWRKHDIFRAAWINEYSRSYLKCFVLDLGTDFADFNNTTSRHPAFFEKIGEKDWGTVYEEPQNWFSKGDHPQSLCGPYFAYLLRVELVPISNKLQIVK